MTGPSPLIEGKYYDASLYGVTEPMALSFRFMRAKARRTHGTFTITSLSR